MVLNNLRTYTECLKLAPICYRCRTEKGTDYNRSAGWRRALRHLAENPRQHTTFLFNQIILQSLNFVSHVQDNEIEG